QAVADHEVAQQQQALAGELALERRAAAQRVGVLTEAAAEDGNGGGERHGPGSIARRCGVGSPRSWACSAATSKCRAHASISKRRRPRRAALRLRRLPAGLAREYDAR